ncbi:MAG TPA: M13 family metallopeptidase, partial [Chitinophagaceae bacterium]|nr:M13 family metallopeptidase [Chitinophagaceae bacterium]
MRICNYLFLCAGTAFIILTGCHSGGSTQNNAQTDFLDLTGMDTSVSPGENFFLYANGNWIKHTQIPPSKTGWGSFYTVYDKSLHDMRNILDSCMNLKDPQKGTVAQQIGDLYASAMDSTAIDKAGISPLTGDLSRIGNIRTEKGILDEIAVEFNHGNGAVFSFYGAPDDKNSGWQVAHFDQGGLGLPNRDYYFKTDSISKMIRTAYQGYIRKLFMLSGTDSVSAAKKALGIMKLETAMAKSSKSPVDLRDPKANYHPFTLPALDKITPGINWQYLTSQLNIREDTVLVGQPAFYHALSGLLKSTPVNVWRDYLQFHLISDYASLLSSPFSEAKFNFYNRLLNGQQEQEPRWKRMSALVDGTLGDALGQLYVQRYFPPAAKQRMIDLVNNLQATYKYRIAHLDWMSDSTKQKAIAKLEAFNKKIGYPDKWKDYSAIDINRGSVITNLEHIGQWHYLYDIHKIGKPVDKSEWGMTPPTVNAYYDPQFNEIVFPAGILQPPFFFPNADDAVNYGAIGAVIGHEMTHGFDDQGSQYDLHGNLKNWWTPEDRKKFNLKASLIIAQYDSSIILDSMHVNGKLTEGENIADIGGLAIAYAAFKNTPEGKSSVKIDG